jgi:hypothetical protein
MNNFMIQDIVGVLLAFVLFPILLIAPGYIAASSFNLLDFANRKLISRTAVAVLISSSISPVIFFLTDRLGTRQLTLFIVLLVFITFIYVLIRDFKAIHFSREDPLLLKQVLILCGAWILFAVMFLSDIQWGDRLYYNVAAFDYSTRASVINAITRTGVPPINPGYFPGQPQPLTFLYYFWYVLCSIIDQAGGRLIDARMALMASVVWTGLALMSAVGIFVQARSPQADSRAVWQKVKLGLGLLLVSGLDIFPSTLFILFPRLLPGKMIDGDMEQWNEQITAWIGSITWTPHHVISLVACLTSWILIASNRTDSLPRQIGAILISGLALASAFGLSVWIVIVFAIFWVIWSLLKLFSKGSFQGIWTMLAPGLVAGIAILPFLSDLLGGPTSGSAGSQFPLAFRIREFFPLDSIVLNSPPWEGNLFKLAALPINYFLELGFFSAVGLLWFQYCRKNQQKNNTFLSAEIALFLTTLILVTFIRSAVISHNDFGWRSWMFAQFILVLWGIDLLEYFWGKGAPSQVVIFHRPRQMEKVRKTLITLIAIGVLTSIFDVILLRTWPMIIDSGAVDFPRILSRDTHLGERTFAAREAFSYIENYLPESSIVQVSPKHLVDTLNSLYRTRPSVISYSTLYGIGQQQYEPLMNGVQELFDARTDNWETLDSTCRQYDINILVLRDIDVLWEKIDSLRATRQPLHSNSYFAIFTCGSYQ